MTGRRQKCVVAAAVGAIAAAAAVLYAVPPEAAGIYPPCVFHTLTGLQCPGCGGTRCAHALLHGDLRQAAAYNLFTLVALPLLAAWAAYRAWGILAGRPNRLPNLPAWAMLAIFAAIVAFWAARNIPVRPFNALAPHRLSDRPRPRPRNGVSEPAQPRVAGAEVPPSPGPNTPAS
jgi:hypothetical protein